MKINFKYVKLSLLLLLTEAAIAQYAHDTIIRPYVGDVLIPVFLYCFVRAFFNTPILSTAVWVLYYCYAVEISQHFNLIGHLGLQNSKAANWLLGSYFSWIDMACYTAGIMVVLLVEHLNIKHPKASLHLCDTL